MDVDYPYNKLACHSLKEKDVEVSSCSPFLFLFLVSFDTGKEVVSFKGSNIKPLFCWLSSRVGLLGQFCPGFHRTR
ncbi:MAG TPA: hypothetical protein VKA87_08160, partial [Nitrososphaeraceae archaeon]|nr:hypothetical protein [Nitrososphaeraceae archaeon]